MVDLKSNVAIVIAVMAVELVSWLMSISFIPGTSLLDHRYLINSILADVLLVYVIKYIIQNCWTIKGWKDASKLSWWISILFAGFQIPHVFPGPLSLAFFSYNLLHKFMVTFVIVMVMNYFKKR